MKNINYKSFYYEYANSTLIWLSSDNKELYHKNIKNNKQKLIDNGWYPNPNINYMFNEHGFRCENFTDESSIMFLGCSYTVGIGLRLEQTFSHHVSEKLNLKNINLGIAGSSSNTAFRLGSYWIPQLKPKIVVYLEFSEARFEVLFDNRMYNLLPRFKGSNIEIEKFYRKYWLEDESNYHLNSLKNKLALEHICEKNGSKFIYSTVNNVIYSHDLARDLMHSGSKSHFLAAEKILHLIDV